MLSTEDSEEFTLTDCEKCIVKSLGMIDKSDFRSAREELMDGLTYDIQNVSALLLMRYIRIDHSHVFGETDISAEEMLRRATEAPTMERERARKFAEYLAANHSRSPSALFLCGSIDEKVQKNLSSAIKFYIKSANLGFAAAQYNVGCFYSNGIGVPENKAEAAKWYQLAADQNRPNAQNNLGVLYLNGQGVPEDRKKAIELFKRAAKSGHVSAKQNYQLAIRPAGIKLPTAAGSVPDCPIESPREELEPWDVSGSKDEDVPLTGAGKSKRRFSFSQRFFGGK